MLPAKQLNFIFDITLFSVLLVPGILWAILKSFLPAREKSVKGQVVLITGAAGGIGRELALRFSGLGAKVACVDVNAYGNNETAELIKKQGGQSVSYRCDVSNREQIKIMHKQVTADLGPVDILINNAGIVWGHAYVDPTKDQFITDQINVNLMGQYWMNREIMPSMLDRNSGHIVAMSSLSSMAGVAGVSTYSVTKWATNGMMECIRNELKYINSNIKTTTILPYFVKTNPKVTAQLDIRFPEMSVKYACDMMMKGILSEKRILSIPGHMMYVTSFARLLPDFLYDMFNKIFYVRIIPDNEAAELYSNYRAQGEHLSYLPNKL